jgi:dienelactone hydrolase
MRITPLVKSVLLLSAGLLLLGAGPRPGPGNYTVSDLEPCYNLEDIEMCSEFTVTGHSQGNHELDCTVIQPWLVDDDPIEELPVIAWANGWGYNDVAGDYITAGYKPGLIEWALDGPYIVVAANQWSVQESDVLQCLQWVIDEYDVPVDSTKIGLSGHSQGGGAIIKAGDGQPNGFDIAATIPMNPYGPGWVRPGNQDGPMMLIGGTDDTTTPTSSFLAVWEAIQSNGQGGLLAELIGGTHNDDAWAPEGGEPEDYDFGRYQEVTELWWQIYLNDSGDLSDLEDLLISEGHWNYEFTDGSD